MLFSCVEPWFNENKLYRYDGQADSDYNTEATLSKMKRRRTFQVVAFQVTNALQRVWKYIWKKNLSLSQSASGSHGTT